MADQHDAHESKRERVHSDRSSRSNQHRNNSYRGGSSHDSRRSSERYSQRNNEHARTGKRDATYADRGDRYRQDKHSDNNHGESKRGDGQYGRSRGNGESRTSFKRDDRSGQARRSYKHDDRHWDDRRSQHRAYGDEPCGDRSQGERSQGNRRFNQDSSTRDDEHRNNRYHADRDGAHRNDRYGNDRYGNDRKNNDRENSDRRDSNHAHHDRNSSNHYGNDQGGNNRRGNDRYARDRNQSSRNTHERYERDSQLDKPRLNSDGTMLYPSQNPYTHRRPNEPVMPVGMQWAMLSADERDRLRGLTKEHSENIGLHILAAYSLIDSDPQAALEHAKWVSHQASRIDISRETLGFIAYRVGDYRLAARELRTALRMNGFADYLPFIADCERGMGNPRKALELATNEQAKHLRGATKAEMFLVYAGCLADLGHLDKAIEVVDQLARSQGLPGAYRMRAYQSKQFFLEEAGRVDEALALDDMLDKLEAQYAEIEDDEDETLIDYDLKQLDDMMMQVLGITEEDAKYAPVDSDRNNDSLSDDHSGTDGDRDLDNETIVDDAAADDDEIDDKAEVDNDFSDDIAREGVVDSEHCDEYVGDTDVSMSTVDTDSSLEGYC